jgi:hypothetical protein
MTAQQWKDRHESYVKEAHQRGIPLEEVIWRERNEVFVPFEPTADEVRLWWLAKSVETGIPVKTLLAERRAEIKQAYEEYLKEMEAR